MSNPELVESMPPPLLSQSQASDEEQPRNSSEIAGLGMTQDKDPSLIISSNKTTAREMKANKSAEDEKEVDSNSDTDAVTQAITSTQKPPSLVATNESETCKTGILEYSADYVIDEDAAADWSDDCQDHNKPSATRVRDDNLASGAVVHQNFQSNEVPESSESDVLPLERNQYIGANPGAVAISGPAVAQDQDSSADSDDLSRHPDDESIPATHLAASLSISGLPFANIVDEDELRRQFLAETMAVDAERIIAKEPVSTRSNIWRRLAYLVLGAAVLLSILLGVVLTNNGSSKTGGRTQVAGPTAYPTAAPTSLVWDQIGAELYPLEEEIPVNSGDVILGGGFGTLVSMSKSGQYVVVGYAEQQEIDFRRRRRHLGISILSYLFQVFNCTEMGCNLTLASQNFGQNSTSISISGDGSRIAVAKTSWYPTFASNITVFSSPIDSSLADLQMIGESIIPEGASMVAMDYSGNLLAMLDLQTGLMSMYSYNESILDWKPLGFSIESNESEHPKAISCSSDGNVVALGSDLVNATTVWCSAEDLGFVGYRVRIYTYSLQVANWIQLGPDFVGARNESLVSAQSLSLSADGSIVAIGAASRDPCLAASGRRSDYGHIQVFQLNFNEMEWRPMGDAILGSQGDAFGWSVALSDDGRTVAVGASEADANGLNSGKVSVFRYEEVSGAWIQVGEDIRGDSGSAFGYSLSLSGDGSIFAVGAPASIKRGANSGAASLFHLTRI